MILLLLSFFLHAVPAEAQCNVGDVGCRILVAHTTDAIAKFGVCKRVHNSGDKNQMIPFLDTSEWASFRNNPPSFNGFFDCFPEGTMSWPNASCTSNDTCSVGTGATTINGAGNIHVTHDCSDLKRSINAGAESSVSSGGLIAVTNAQTLNFIAYGLACDGSGGTPCTVTLRDTSALGPTIDSFTFVNDFVGSCL